jgi:hypothetical protein
MDGFPNGRRLEDDVTTIELQAVSGVALAAIGLWYDDYSGTGSPVTAQLGKVLGFRAGPSKNDTTFQTTFPYVQQPWASFRGASYSANPLPTLAINKLNIGSGASIVATNFPNPFTSKTQIKYNLPANSKVSITIIDMNGRVVNTLVNNQKQSAGVQIIDYNAEALNAGIYYAEISTDYGKASVKMIVK